MSNIFDVDKEQFQPIDSAPQQSNRSSLSGFVIGTATLAFLAVVIPIYIHVLVKIAIWSWNLI